MKLPNYESARIPPEKLTGYLLDLEHEDGGPKAKFLMRFGFSIDEPEVLEAALLAHCAMHDVADVEQFEYGTKYRIRGSLPSPDRRNPVVLVVWRIPAGEENPRLVTLVP